ncbi:MAG: NAD-dependent 4,6-dehydratase LegB [Coriobacteriia bacterium]|nr:NAD-dependent 4,6-dehydratase LegB [Coriobacteriia bacterium]
MDLRDKRVLVTGADGFIGSHLIEALMDLGADVRPFVYYNSFGSWGWLDTLPAARTRQLDVFAGDIRDPNGVRTAMKDVDVVLHLAALIAIPFSYHSPDSYIDTNVKGTLNVLQAARDLGIERLAVTSTSEVYGTAKTVPIDETHPRQGQSPYSASKIGADALADSFYRSFGTPVVTVRPFNTYGPRQSARAVIPTIITQLLSGADEVRLGALTPTRDLNYVTDTCAGYIAAVSCDDSVGREINVSNGKEISIGDLATMLIDIINPAARIASDEQRMRPEASEVERLLGSTRLLHELTGWEPAISLRDGLERTTEWFRDPVNLSRYKWDIYNV